LVPLLADPDAWWRETAQRLLIERNDPAAVPLLKALAAARPTALGRLHALNTLDALGALAPDGLQPAFADPEPGVREAVARLAERFVSEDASTRRALLALADDPEPMVRFQAAFSIGAIADKAAVEALDRLVRRDAADPWTRAAVVSSAGGRAGELLGRVAVDPSLIATEGGRALLEALAYQIGAEGRPEATAEVVRRATAEGAGPGPAGALLGGLGRGLRRRGGSLRDVAGGPGLERLFGEAAATAGSAEAPPEARAAAVRLLGLGPIDRALEVLPPLLQPREPAAVQLAAIGSLAGLPDPRVGPVLIDRWRSLGPALRREAVEALLARPDRAGVLLQALADGAIPPADLDPVRRQQLLAYPAAEIRKRAEFILGGSARPDRGAVLAAYRPALERPGEPVRGRTVFDRTCATCHTAEGRGQVVGPALETVAGRAAEDILSHILDPNREVAPVYLNYTLATTDGRVFSGLVADESAAAVTLRRAEGATDIVPRDQIEAMTSTGLSLMPENLETQIDPAAMADLLAYIRGLTPGR
jgi:putative heme-binding domain-containing protein